MNHKKEAQSVFERYVCAICLDSSTNTDLLEAHVHERHHVEFVEQCMLYQCTPCGSRFGNPDQLWAHVVSHHPADFKQLQNETGNQIKVQNNVKNSDNQNGLQRFICKFCGLRFDLLPDLGRHHQATHMGLNPNGLRKRGVGDSFYSNKLKPRRRFKKGLRMLTGGGGTVKKHIQDPFREIVEGEFQTTESVSLGRLAESECLDIAKLLYYKVNKTKSHPGNLQILAIARSACCRTSFHASLEKIYGVMPERIYLKAAKLCSKHNVVVEWHQEGYICPKGCKLTSDYSHMLPSVQSLPEVSHRSVTPALSVTSEWPIDESHYVINFNNPKQEASERGIVLCDDSSFGKESVQVACVVDEHLLGSLQDDDGPTKACFLPWESFTYATKPLLDQSLDLKSQEGFLMMTMVGSFLRYGKEGCSFIYEIDARVNDMIRVIEGEVTYAIDATKYGNVSRYINHSCSPNLENHQVLIESMDSQMSHIGLYACQDIEVGEELCLDYMYKTPLGEGCQCKCGAENCRVRVQ